MADRECVVLLGLGDDGTVAIVSVADMIADRMGQFASGSAPEMLAQARSLYALHPDVDHAYLDSRIRYGTGGDYALAQLKS